MAYLTQEEKLATRKLWEEIFPEDSEGFNDFYYTEKIKTNRIMVRREGNQMVAMLHLNPYRVMVKNQIWRCDYIVGVGTVASQRHKGHMRALLTDMLADMYQEGRQFCFLMPADPAIYRPFDFTYIFDKPHLKLKAGTDIEKVPYDLVKGSEHHPVQEIADWMNMWLHDHYEVYAFRDHEYIEMFLKELGSEQGELNLLYNADRLVGIECLWGVNEREQRAFLCEKAYCEEESPATPAIMARIVNLSNFIKVIRLKKGCGKMEFTVRLVVEDRLCEGNQGYWRWHLTLTGSTLEKIEDGAADGNQEYEIRMTIQELTSWLFGYHIPEGAEWTEWIQPLRGVFLDEIV